MIDLRSLKVGDTIPCDFEIDRAAVHAVRIRRGQLEAAEARGGTNEHINRARLILAGQRERAERLANPVEQAKAFLRRKGLIVYCGTVQGYEEGTFVVGTKLRTEAGMMALAERLGWERPE